MSDRASERNSRRRVAAVTGGAGGIGQDIVAALTGREFDVVLCLTRAICRRMLAAAATFRKSAHSIVFTRIDRWDIPADVGRAVATLAAGELPFTSGAAIQVDGGMPIHQY